MYEEVAPGPPPEPTITRIESFRTSNFTLPIDPTASLPMPNQHLNDRAVALSGFRANNRGVYDGK